MVEEVEIDRLGAGGDGIAERDGRALFVAGALPGERAEIEPAGERGRLVRLLSESPNRAEPFCPYYGRCGGCVAQHLGPPLYAPWKRAKVVSALERAGLHAPVDVLADAHGAGRRRMTLHAREIDGAVAVGFMEARSHRLVPIARCPITVPALAEAPAAARRLAAALASVGKPLDVVVTATDAGLDVELRGSGPLGEKRRQVLVGLAAALDLARLSLHGEALITRRPPAIGMGRARIVPPPAAFLQATEAGEVTLAAAVLAGCAGAKRVADLFAGCGPFALRLAERAEVHAVEGDAGMLEALDRAARETPGLRRVTTETRDLFRRPLLPMELDRFDAVVLDPPRSGAEAQARQIAASAIGTAVLVSCDPGTFARDAATLVAAGFHLERVLPVDQFKWSAHVEIAGLFKRRARPHRRRR